MGKHLVIVESPAKARTINKFLGRDYRVKASRGHIRDLPKNPKTKSDPDWIGVDEGKDFEPHYQVLKEKEKTVTADDAEDAESLIGQWLEAVETELIAIDDELLSDFDAAFRRKLETAEQLPYLAIPSGEPRGPEGARRRRVSELIRRAIGFRITFKGEQASG